MAGTFGVDESELQLNVSGTADNGLNYGFKIEINANTSDGTVADEVRLQLSGGWGTLQMGDEDGAEDIMNYGGENLMGATGGFDGDQDDVLLRTTWLTHYDWYYCGPVLAHLPVRLRPIRRSRAIPPTHQDLLLLAAVLRLPGRRQPDADAEQRRRLQG